VEAEASWICEYSVGETGLQPPPVHSSPMGHSLSDAHAPPLNSGPTSEELLQDSKIEAISIRKIFEKPLFIEQPAGCRLSRTVRKPGSHQNAPKAAILMPWAVFARLLANGSSGEMSPDSPILLIGLSCFFLYLYSLENFQKNTFRSPFSAAQKAEAKIGESGTLRYVMFPEFSAKLQ
jgi:hypothetical protein